MSKYGPPGVGYAIIALEIRPWKFYSLVVLELTNIASRASESMINQINIGNLESNT